ncbi:hypothetical protein SPRG_03423 [Saprolegnia parasitica CBS 223.65]|uniref:Uncharacterized protein n=1 Tax=Saprolegnia parasitica (strain CBS 223.65) TaxID=695850 RepID=A0A067D0E1_SAPPC|nr:hypothetical protein SPRG_03423 [Saprolegnia parasitica CBS 223.65]KDO32206.1 hypothetical protein SPRG_03423 [Saprolegnia parasitica CBS 223.65]|eukprot:XP_012197386.1 hypothetical protein SPRG_03423 [Saprolegnia parasitica CBS 223.65]
MTKGWCGDLALLLPKTITDDDCRLICSRAMYAHVKVQCRVCDGTWHCVVLTHLGAAAMTNSGVESSPKSLSSGATSTFCRVICTTMTSTQPAFTERRLAMGCRRRHDGPRHGPGGGAQVLPLLTLGKNVCSTTVMDQAATATCISFVPRHAPA